VAKTVALYTHSGLPCRRQNQPVKECNAMLWQTLEPSRRVKPCGQAAMPFAGRSISLSADEHNYLGRWRD